MKYYVIDLSRMVMIRFWQGFVVEGIRLHQCVELVTRNALYCVGATPIQEESWKL